MVTAHTLSRSGANRIGAAWRMFLFLVILGFVLRAGYGVARYGSAVINRTGDAFISAWNHDALDHVLIAKAILTGKGYVVDRPPVSTTAPVRFVGQEALFKAPLYEFFLAGVFAVSGFSFKLLIPLQALLGGLLTGLIGLIALQVFRSASAAWFAGVAAAAHPILVNSASQPYNENLFFFFFAASIWMFLIWLQNLRWPWALGCGSAIGLCMLTRENAVLLLFAMGVVVLLTYPPLKKGWVGYGIIALTATALVLPWSIRNYVRFGIFVPVASILGEDLSEGNNECVGGEGVFVPYWAEGRCASVDQQRRAQSEATSGDTRIPVVVRRDRISRHIALQFMSSHPGTYAKLAFRRFWTTLLPYDPRGDQRTHERIVLLLYWLLLFPPGILGMWLGLKQVEPARVLLALLIVLNLLSIAAVLYWSDLRFRVGIDMLLGCFAGLAYTQLVRLRAGNERSLHDGLSSVVQQSST